MPEVREERTGWRDLALSERHRHWGWDCPGVDLDFLFLEYDKGLPTAIVEYKHEYAAKVKLSTTTYNAISVLSDNSNIPFFVCRYKGDFSGFTVTPVNNNAKKILPDGAKLTEAGWVRFLYKLRGYDCPQSIIDGLKTIV